MKKILCFLGFHTWQWTLLRVSEHETEPLTGSIPDRAICKHCEIKYK